MLKIINNLSHFFEDCYRRIGVREYARVAKISPPTASKLLSSYHKEGLLKQELSRRDIFYYANKESKTFRDLSRIYWSYKLERAVNFIEEKAPDSAVILFGSLAKAEAKSDSDMDIAIFSVTKEVNLRGFEKRLKRKIEVFLFSSFRDIKNKELANNILNGFIIHGRIRD